MEYDESILRKLFLAGIQVKRVLKKEVEAKVKSGICLIEGCNNPAIQRGLCKGHIQMFYHKRRSMASDSARLRFENELIRKGLIPRPGEQAKISAGDPFSQVANSIGSED